LATVSQRGSATIPVGSFAGRGMIDFFPASISASIWLVEANSFGLLERGFSLETLG
jgi:hypothetical protein